MNNHLNLNEWFGNRNVNTIQEKITSAYVPYTYVVLREVENAPYSVEYYTQYKNLVKRSTLRLRKMYAKTFTVSFESTANIQRQSMIKTLFNELQTYKNGQYEIVHDVKLMYFDNKTQTWFTPNMCDAKEALEINIVGKGRPRIVPKWLQEAMYMAWVEIGKNKWNILLDMFQEVAQMEGINLYPQLVRQLCVTFTPDAELNELLHREQL